jgi:DNA-binding transcriptional MerR regulator
MGAAPARERRVTTAGIIVQTEFVNDPLPPSFSISRRDHERLVLLLYCNMQRALRVGSVAKKTGVGVQTLHYYERINLLPKPARSESNYRLYSSDIVRRVTFIKKAQAIGFTLAEIKEILALKGHGRAPCRKVTEFGERHLRDIDARLVKLRRYRRAVAESLNSWLGKTVHRRNCAGEFCDLIEHLP